MSNFNQRDYAINKYDDAIVYRTAKGEIIKVGREDCISLNCPDDLAEEAFKELKRLSDAIYEEEDKAENRKSKMVKSLDALSISAYDKLSFDEYQKLKNDSNQLMGSYQELETNQRVHVAHDALDSLTVKQKSRYVLHHAYGTSMREIAKAEGVSHTAVEKSIHAAQKKIEKYLRKHVKNRLPEPPKKDV